jgi:hypothetical protein
MPIGYGSRNMLPVILDGMTVVIYCYVTLVTIISFGNFIEENHEF